MNKEILETLYISDLDGTLLDKNARLTKKSSEIISSLINKGMLITFATARSQSSVEIMNELGIKIPAVHLNGVLIYDFKKNKYTSCTAIDVNSARDVIGILRKFDRMSFVYKFDNDCGINVEFEMLKNDVERNFFNARKDKDYKSFRQIEKITISDYEKVIYFTMVDRYERLEPIYREILDISGVNATLYSDNYSDLYFLEIFSSNATKAEGVKKIKEELGVKRVVAFGDNLNDIEMLNYADVGIAVGDAVQIVKNKADIIIGNSYEDGVALYLQGEYYALHN